MGWKNVKEHYRIEHIVCVTEAGICIGSPYIHDLIVISMDGDITKKYPSPDDWTVNEHLARYMREFVADMDKLRSLVTTPDTFEKSITVYTYGDGQIIEKQCEEPSWPNVTHDGELMYDNMFSTDREEVLEWALDDAKAGVRFWQKQIEKHRSDLQEAESLLEKTKAEVAALESLEISHD